MTISKLRVLTETTFDDFPDKSIEKFVRDAVDEYDTIRDLFGKLVYSTIICDGALLADPKIYNDMVKIFNKSIT